MGIFDIFKRKPEKLVRLILSDGRYRQPCEDCKRDASLGWMPLGKMRLLFERECGESCTCQLEFNWQSTAVENKRYEQMAREKDPEFFAEAEAFAELLKRNRK